MIPVTIWNQFGASLGGPIKKNKIFYFGDYQGTRRITGGSVLSRVPLLAERTGAHIEAVLWCQYLLIRRHGTKSRRRRTLFQGAASRIEPDRIQQTASLLTPHSGPERPRPRRTRAEPLRFRRREVQRRRPSDTRVDFYQTDKRTLVWPLQPGALQYQVARDSMARIRAAARVTIPSGSTASAQPGNRLSPPTTASVRALTGLLRAKLARPTFASGSSADQAHVVPNVVQRVGCGCNAGIPGLNLEKTFNGRVASDF